MVQLTLLHFHLLPLQLWTEFVPAQRQNQMQALFTRKYLELKMHKSDISVFFSLNLQAQHRVLSL